MSDLEQSPRTLEEVISEESGSRRVIILAEQASLISIICKEWNINVNDIAPSPIAQDHFAGMLTSLKQIYKTTVPSRKEAHSAIQKSPTASHLRQNQQNNRPTNARVSSSSSHAGGTDQRGSYPELSPFPDVAFTNLGVSPNTRRPLPQKGGSAISPAGQRQQQPRQHQRVEPVIANPPQMSGFEHSAQLAPIPNVAIARGPGASQTVRIVQPPFLPPHPVLTAQQQIFMDHYLSRVQPQQLHLARDPKRSPINNVAVTVTSANGPRPRVATADPQQPPYPGFIFPPAVPLPPPPIPPAIHNPATSRTPATNVVPSNQTHPPYPSNSFLPPHVPPHLAPTGGTNPLSWQADSKAPFQGTVPGLPAFESYNFDDPVAANLYQYYFPYLYYGSHFGDWAHGNDQQNVYPPEGLSSSPYVYDWAVQQQQQHLQQQQQQPSSSSAEQQIPATQQAVERDSQFATEPQRPDIPDMDASIPTPRYEQARPTSSAGEKRSVEATKCVEDGSAAEHNAYVSGTSKHPPAEGGESHTCRDVSVQTATTSVHPKRTAQPRPQSSQGASPKPSTVNVATATSSTSTTTSSTSASSSSSISGSPSAADRPLSEANSSPSSLHTGSSLSQMHFHDSTTHIPKGSSWADIQDDLDAFGPNHRNPTPPAVAVKPSERTTAKDRPHQQQRVAMWDEIGRQRLHPTPPIAPTDLASKQSKMAAGSQQRDEGPQSKQSDQRQEHKDYKSENRPEIAKAQVSADAKDIAVQSMVSDGRKEKDVKVKADVDADDAWNRSKKRFGNQRGKQQEPPREIGGVANDSSPNSVARTAAAPATAPAGNTRAEMPSHSKPQQNRDLHEQTAAADGHTDLFPGQREPATTSEPAATRVEPSKRPRRKDGAKYVLVDDTKTTADVKQSPIEVSSSANLVDPKPKETVSSSEPNTTNLSSKTVPAASETVLEQTEPPEVFEGNAGNQGKKKPKNKGKKQKEMNDKDNTPQAPADAAAIETEDQKERAVSSAAIVSAPIVPKDELETRKRPEEKMKEVPKKDMEIMEDQAKTEEPSNKRSKGRKKKSESPAPSATEEPADESIVDVDPAPAISSPKHKPDLPITSSTSQRKRGRKGKEMASADEEQQEKSKAAKEVDDETETEKAPIEKLQERTSVTDLADKEWKNPKANRGANKNKGKAEDQEQNKGKGKWNEKKQQQAQQQPRQQQQQQPQPKKAKGKESAENPPAVQKRPPKGKEKEAPGTLAHIQRGLSTVWNTMAYSWRQVSQALVFRIDPNDTFCDG